MYNNHWLKVRKALLKQVKNQVFLRTGQFSSGLKSYAKAYEQEFSSGKWTVRVYKDLLNDIAMSRLVLGAEFHPHAQSQRTHLRILRQIPDERPVVLALECLEAQHQEVINRYMNAELTDDEFLESIGWNERWGFSWANYKPLFTLAKKNNFKVVGINKYYKTRSSRTLKYRDAHSAKLIIKTLKEHPDSLIYVVYGEWHLAKKHLPAEIYKIVPELKSKTVIVFQNAEKLYFKLAQDQKEQQVQVLKGVNNRYCLINSPPWVQWQNYLMFLDQNELLIDVDWDDGDIDFTDYVFNQLKFICKDLKIKNSFPDFSVYSPDQITEWQDVDDKLPLRLSQYSDYCMKSDRSFYLPEYKLLYLSRPSTNQMATLAGVYLSGKLSGLTTTPCRMPEDFDRMIWLEALGFFTSKLVNHRRKSESLDDLKLQLAAQSLSKNQKSVLLIALEHRFNEILFLQGHAVENPRFKTKNVESYFEAARILGTMMGERIYAAYRSEKLTHKKIKEFMQKNIYDDDFNEFYYSVVKLVGNQSIPFTVEGIVYD